MASKPSQTGHSKILLKEPDRACRYRYRVRLQKHLEIRPDRQTVDTAGMTFGAISEVLWIRDRCSIKYCTTSTWHLERKFRHMELSLSQTSGDQREPRTVQASQNSPHQSGEALPITSFEPPLLVGTRTSHCIRALFIKKY